MSIKEWVPKLSVRITEDQYHALAKVFDVGHRKAVFGAIVDNLIRITTDADGNVLPEAGIILGAITAGSLRLGVNDETDLLRRLGK